MHTWSEIDAEQKRLQIKNPKFSRAALCRFAGISGSTFTKGLKRNSRITPAVREKLRLRLMGERAAQAAGLRE